jgi:hypothetical protein
MEKTKSSAPSTRWIMLGSGAVARQCFLPAFEHLNKLSDLTVGHLEK